MGGRRSGNFSFKIESIHSHTYHRYIDAIRLTFILTAADSQRKLISPDLLPKLVKLTSLVLTVKRDKAL